MSPLLGRALAAVMLAAPAALMAQAELPAAGDPAATRVLSVAGMQGTGMLGRNGRHEALRPGFLVFDGDSLELDAASRAELQLGGHAALVLASSDDGGAALHFERLPVSTWAADRDTRMRLDHGLLRLARGGADDQGEWPVAVQVDRWFAQMGAGEFLYRRDARGVAVCKLSGALVVSDAGAGWREQPAEGQCLLLEPGQAAPRREELAGQDWRALQPVTSAGATVALAADRSLAVAAPVAARAKSSVVPPAPGSAVPPAPPLGRVPDTTAVPVSPAAIDPPDLERPLAPAAARAVAAPSTAAGIERVPATIAVAVRPSTIDASALDPSAPRRAPPGSAPRLALSSTLSREATAPAAVAPAAVAVPPPPLTLSTPLAPPVSQRPLSGEAASQVEPGGTAPVPTAAALPATAPQAAGNPEWIVNVMTLTDPKLANDHLTELARLGYPAQLRQETVRGRVSYRLVVGGIGSEQGARRTAQLLAGKGYPGAWPLQKR